MEVGERKEEGGNSGVGGWCGGRWERGGTRCGRGGMKVGLGRKVGEGGKDGSRGGAGWNTASFPWRENLIHLKRLISS